MKIHLRKIKRLITTRQRKRRDLARKAKHRERQRIAEESNQKAIHKIFQSSEPVVLNGPFRGLNYVKSSSGSALMPKIIGSYEEPIHPWIERVCKSGRYKAIFDIGCAEGYYACGFAVRNPEAVVFAYDVDEVAITRARRLAEINSITNIDFKNEFSMGELEHACERYVREQIFLFLDIEGAERELISGHNKRTFTGIDMLVELHDCFFPGITEQLTTILQHTHEITIVVDYPWRNVKKYQHSVLQSTGLPFENLMDEKRPEGMKWLLAIAKENT